MSTGALFEPPPFQPYGEPYYDGTLMDYDNPVVVGGLGPEIIDWVVLSLRETILAASEVARRVALLREDGQLLNLDASTTVNFPGVAPGSYYVVVCHRNHACAMSDLPVAFSPNGTWDFVTGAAYSLGPPPLKHFGGSAYGLFAADANADGLIQALDFNLYLESTLAGLIGYERADFNMDGNVQALDFNLYLTNTLAGSASQVP
jgi:hypothetical protein